MKEMLEAGRQIDRVWVIGPAVMMKFCALATQPFGILIIVNLNSIMVDGTGMCGACRVEVGGQTCFACVNGSEFDGQQVDWDLLMVRQRIYGSKRSRQSRGGPRRPQSVRMLASQLIPHRCGESGNLWGGGAISLLIGGCEP